MDRNIRIELEKLVIEVPPDPKDGVATTATKDKPRDTDPIISKDSILLPPLQKTVEILERADTQVSKQLPVDDELRKPSEE